MNAEVHHYQAAMEASPTRDLAHDGNPTRFIPFELTFEILSRLPAKPLIRFQSVSKLWFSIIRSKDFADSFLIRSKTRPRLLFSFQHFDSRQRFIFSAPEHHNNNNDEEEEKSSSTVIARHDMTISDLVYDINTRPVNGLVCCTRKLDSSSSSIAVCNPTTRQILKLPDVTPNGRDMYARLGYDPVEDQYKVLCVMMFDGFDSRRADNIEQEHFVFTLGSQQQEWRKVEIVQGDPYTSFKGGICINGAIYYVVLHKKIARFDVRSEKMEFIKAPEDEEDLEINAFCWTLINHKGRLGGINYRYFYHMRAWIQEEEESWNNMTGVVTSEWGDLLREISLYSTGEIHTGEVLLVPYRLESSKPFSVFYYDMIRESFRSGQVLGIADYEFRRRFHGFGKRNRGMRCFPGHIENIMFF
ncbi:F-box protein At1g30790 [Eutrema salsugineum]|uniref:F-box protein At1g30790 n=1 Tax=Eutrema salsugineum TaxID=72664 RepID=UPI000CED5F35|nr:F-box protein At1g30790 [Eutrema salsugineum]